MTFQQLLDGAEILSQSVDPGVSGVEYDSRRVKPGCVFVAMRGESSDGNRFIDQAIRAGAVAVVTDSAAVKPRDNVAWAVVPHGRRALARLSANFYKRPAERLAGTGITGTNGKSTTAFQVESILTAAGRKSALIGTIEYHVAGKILPAPHTTPEALDLHRILNETLGQGATDAGMEGSYHTRWRRSACLACRLMWRCSPILRGIISTITKRWTSILRPSEFCLRGVVPM